MVKRKHDEFTSCCNDVNSIPLAIQSFLWRQTEPFLRQKLGKLYEASCVSFEHVLVENKLHGLPPSLHDAIIRTPRRRLIEAALPHVMHCAAILLSNRNKLGHADKLGVPATKLLHTFHSILQESMQSISSCDVEGDIGSISNIQLFVFLFAPLANTIKESDLTFRLASGLKTWEALWNHDVPDVPAMRALVRPHVVSNNRGSPLYGNLKDVLANDNRGPCIPGPVKASSRNQVTTFDIAVLRCLFFPRWSEEGVTWAVTYLLKRLLPDNVIHRNQTHKRNALWRRSKSVTVPKSIKSDIATGGNSLKQTASTVHFSTTTADDADKKSQIKQDTEKKSFGIFNRLRFSEKRRKSRIRYQYSGNRSKFSMEAPRDASPSRLSPEQDETKTFAERRTISVRQKGADFRRRTFKRFASSTILQQDSTIKDDDDPPSYETVARRGPWLRKQLSVGSNCSELPSNRTDEVAAKVQPQLLPASVLDESSSDKSTSYLMPIVFARPALRRDTDETVESRSGFSYLGDCKLKNRHSDDLPSNLEKIMKELPSCSTDHSNHEAANDLEHNPLQRRWVSDTCISYSRTHHAMNTEVNSPYLTADGYFRADVILQAVEVVILRDPGVKIYDICLQILECLKLNVYTLTPNATSKLETSNEKCSMQEKLDSKLAQGKKMPEKDDVIQFLNIIFKIVRAMGCLRNCGRYGHRGSAGEKLRQKARALMISMYSYNDTLFCEHLPELIKRGSLKEGVDLIHLVLIACEVEFNSVEPDADNVSEWTLKSEPVNPEDKMKSGLTKIIFEVFVRRCIENQDDLYAAHNRALYRDVRECVQYVKKYHAAIFNKLLLTVMLIPAKKRRKWKKAKDEQEKEKRNAESQRESRASSFGQRSNGQRRGAIVFTNSPLFPRPSHHSSKSLPKLRPRFSVLWNDNSTEDTSGSYGGEGGSQNRTSSVFGRLPLGSWLKSKNSSTSSLNGEESDNPFHTIVNEKPRSNERSFMNMIKSKTIKKQISDPVDSVIHDNLINKPSLESEFKNRRKSKTKDFLVDENDICDGVGIMRFLMDCCPPGTVPEAKILSAVLDLESPAICRAIFFLECAVFIHRCAHSEWPRWMLSGNESNITRLIIRATKQIARNNLKLQMSAGKLFYSWGEAVSSRLEYLCNMESGTVFVLPNVRSEAEKFRLREKDINENFQITVNRSGNACPVALKMMASQLLAEITTFIRDVAPNFQKIKRNISTLIVNRSEEESVSSQTNDSAMRGAKGSNLQPTRRKSISFLDDHDKITQQQHLSIQPADNKCGRRSAPESYLRTELKVFPCQSPKHQNSILSAEFVNTRRTSVASAGCPLAELKEDSPLLSDSIDVPVNEEHHSFVTSTSLDDSRPVSRIGRRDSMRCQIPSTNSNFLMVPCMHSGAMSQSNSFSSYGGISAGSSILSLGEGSCNIDDGHSLSCFDRSSLYLSSSSIISHADPPHTPSTMTESHSDYETWMMKIPWLPVMIALANQQNFVCEHKHFCHAFCHKRLVRSCRRLNFALCRALDQVDGARRRFPRTSSDHSTQEIYNNYVLRYLKTNASSLMSAPLNVLTKGAAMLNESMIFDVQSLCWEMILNDNKDISTASAVLFLLCATKIPQQIFSSISAEFTHIDANIRLDAILKFQVLWDCRYSVYSRAQEGANRIFKITPARVNYTLPKEPIGTKYLPIPDAPWLPSIGNLEEAVFASTWALENSALLTTDTTSHQKEKQMKRAMKKAEEERAAARAKFRLTDIPVTQFVAAEVQKSQNVPQEEEDAEALSANRRAASICSSTYSNKENRQNESRPSSRQIGRPSKRDGESSDYKSDDQQSTRDSNPSKTSAVFPSCIAACIPMIIDCCKDTGLSKNNFSVGEMAQKTIETCLIEDPALFIGHIFEKLSDKDSSQRKMANLLQKLPLILGRLAPHVAYTIFVNVLGIILRGVRLQTPACDENVISCIGVLASIAPYVEGLDLKSLKMAFRKEQSDLQLLITSGLPGPRKLTIWNNSDYYMPTLVDVNDDSTFESVIKDAMVQNDIPENQLHRYQLIDTRLKKINCPHAYVRDFYSFNKKVYPELTLIEMDPEVAEVDIKARAILTQLEEINKLRFTLSVLVSKRTSAERQLNASFILEEFLRLKSFPQKAIEAPFPLFVGQGGRQIFDIDMMQKCWWIELISTTLFALPSEFPWRQELLLFIHVWNAALVIHSEQLPILRQYCAAVIDAAVHLNHQFIQYGYSLVLPTILQVYSEHYCMPTVRRGIEFLCKQLHIIHRNPFVLELIASAAPILTAYANSLTQAAYSSQKHLSPEKFYNLLNSLEVEFADDSLQILELIKADRPLQSLDFCYKNDSLVFTIVDCLKLCVTVVACQPESGRTLEMLIVFDKILPIYLRELHKKTKATQRTATEIHALKEIVICIRALLCSLDCLTRNLAHQPTPHQATHRVLFREGSIIHGQSRILSTPKSRCDSERVLEEGGLTEDSQERFRVLTEEFVAPRDLVLHLCSKYYTHTRKRLSHLEVTSAQNTELLNDKSHTKLAEIAQSLLKLLTEESFSVHCPGLLTYLTEMIPAIDWTDEHIRGALFLILKRLDRLFLKISTMSEISKQNLNWFDVRLIIQGLSDLITNQPVVSVIPHLKSIITINLSMLIESSAGADCDSSPKSLSYSDGSLPKIYAAEVIKLTLVHLNSLKATLTLEDLVRHTSQDKRDYVTLNLFVPLCISVVSIHNAENSTGNRKAVGKMPIKECDVMYMFDYAFDVLTKDSSSNLESNISQLLLFTSPDLVALYLSYMASILISHRRTSLSHQVALLLLRVLITCFHIHLSKQWFKIAKKIKEVVFLRIGDSCVWSFMDFIMSLKTPLLLYLRPFVLCQMIRSQTDAPNFTEWKIKLRKELTRMKPTRINLPSLVGVYDSDVARLKYEIVTTILGSKTPVNEKPNRDGKTRSFRHAVLPGAFSRKGSTHESSVQKSKNLPNIGCSSTPPHHSSVKQVRDVQMDTLENTDSKAEVKQQASPSKQTTTKFNKTNSSRRWTQKSSLKSSSPWKLMKPQRYSVDGVEELSEDIQKWKLTPRKTIKQHTRHHSSNIPSIHIDSAKSSAVTRSKRMDESITIKDTERIQKTKDVAPKSDPTKRKNIRSMSKDSSSSRDSTTQFIFRITAPTPPQRRSSIIPTIMNEIDEYPSYNMLKPRFFSDSDTRPPASRDGTKNPVISSVSGERVWGRKCRPKATE